MSYAVSMLLLAERPRCNNIHVGCGLSYTVGNGPLEAFIPFLMSQTTSSPPKRCLCCHPTAGLGEGWASAASLLAWLGKGCTAPGLVDTGLGEGWVLPGLLLLRLGEG